jgi:hypothetical protein
MKILGKPCAVASLRNLADGLHVLFVIALPRGARVHELRLLLAQYGSTQIAE